MPTVTISSEITKGAELVIMSKADYQRLLSARIIPEYQPTAAEKSALVRARKNRLAGKFFTIDELKNKLGFTG